MKSEAFAIDGAPFAPRGFQVVLSLFQRWYNEERPHQSLLGATPDEIRFAAMPAIDKPGFEPRARYPARRGAIRLTKKRGARAQLVVTPMGIEAFHLPVVRLKRAA
jgi:hypothetical protein